MSYYFSKTVHLPFDRTIAKVTAALAERGFGVLTTIDVRQTMKKRLDVEMSPYTILGACNPTFAHQALEAEDKIGTMLPCNVIVREMEEGGIEIAAVDPVASMQAITNPKLAEIAGKVRNLLRETVESL